MIPEPTVTVRMGEDVHIALSAPIYSGLIFLEGIIMKTNHNRTRLLVMVAVFSAIAYVLQMIGSFMGLKVGGFLEIEFSDLPPIILSFAYGPIAGVLSELIKNLLHCFTTSTGFVGEFANFVINGTFCFVVGIIYKYRKNIKGAIISLSAGTVAMSIAGIFANLFIMLPLYMSSAPFNVKLDLVLWTILPFNIVKGIVISIITLLIYKKISPILKGKNQ